MHAPTDSKISYTIRNLAEVTGLSERSWWRLIREGRIATLRIGQRVLVTHAALLEFMAAHTNTDGAPMRDPPPHVRKRMEAARSAAEASA